jgi:hypothetical protein
MHRTLTAVADGYGGGAAPRLTVASVGDFVIGWLTQPKLKFRPPSVMMARKVLNELGA